MNRHDSKGAVALAADAVSEIRLARQNHLVLAASGMLCGIPVVADLLLSKRPAPFRYFTSDTYYYLNVARHFAATGLFSFDGENPTNGFHPLWQIILALLYKLCLPLHISDLAYCYLVILLCACFATLAILITGWTICRIRGVLPVSFTLLPVGLYALLLSPLWIYTQDVVGNISPAEGPLPLYGTTWSYANGMESSLALLSYALLGQAWTKAAHATNRGALLVGLLGALVVLARLDQIFIAGSILAFLAYRWITTERWRSVSRVLALSAGCAIPVGVYLLVNLHYCGLAFPVSGAAKFSLAHISRGNIHGLHSLMTVGMSSPFWLDRLFRMTQMVLPAVAGIGLLITSWRLVRTPEGEWLERRLTDDWSVYMAATAVGVLVLCTAVFLLTGVPAYGSWSLPVPVFFVSLAFLSVCPEMKRLRRYFGIVLGAELCVGLGVFCALHRQSEYHEKYRLFYMNRKAITDVYGERKPRLIEYDDGIIGFATHFHTLSAFNVATDKELYQAISKNRLLTVARERGYDHIASLVYLPSGRNLTGTSALRYLAGIYGSDTSAKAGYSLEYFDPTIPFAIAKITYSLESDSR
jgi:hypothetical protein